MPWHRTRLPPSPGTVRAVDPDQLVVWTEHGLFRYEPGPNPYVRMLHDAAEAQAKFDPASGVMRWGRERYSLVGDPAVVPNAGVEARDTLTAWDDDRVLFTVRVDVRRRRAEVTDAAGAVALVVGDFPAAGAAWHFAGFHDRLVLADPAGLRRYEWADPPPTPVGKWAAAGDGYAALLAGVIAVPDADLPRLVLADWLEEHGDAEHAEFIRVQCRIAERERTAPVPDNDPDALRAAELAKAHGAGWCAELPRVAGVRMPDSDARGWWRGFPGVRVNSAVTLGRKLGPLLAVGPVERAEVVCPDVRGAEALLKSPVVAGLRVLEMRVMSDADRHGVAALLKSPALTRLRGLTLWGGESAANTLVTRAAHLTGLEWLSVTWADDAAAAALAAARRPPALKWVRLGRRADYTKPTVQALRKRFARVVFRG